jgi:hypothetical protein
MKQGFIITGISLGLLIVGCSTEGMNNDHPSENVSESTKTGITCKDLLFQKDELLGKTVTVSAYNWGAIDLLGGGCTLCLGDDQSEGIHPANVVADFYSNADEKVKKIAVGEWVTLKALVSGYESGAVHLMNPIILK